MVITACQDISQQTPSWPKKRLHSVTAKCDYQPIIQHVFRFCLIMWYQKSATIVNLLFFHLGFSSEALAFRKMLICVAVTGTTILHRSTQCDITLSRSTMCIAQPKSCLNLGDFLKITRLSICRPNELITHSCCRFFQRRPAGGPRGDFTPQALFLKEMRGRKKKKENRPLLSVLAVSAAGVAENSKMRAGDRGQRGLQYKWG